MRLNESTSFSFSLKLHHALFLVFAPLFCPQTFIANSAVFRTAQHLWSLVLAVACLFIIWHTSPHQPTNQSTANQQEPTYYLYLSCCITPDCFSSTMNITLILSPILILVIKPNSVTISLLLLLLLLLVLPHKYWKYSCTLQVTYSTTTFLHDAKCKLSGNTTGFGFWVLSFGNSDTKIWHQNSSYSQTQTQKEKENV